MKDDGSDPAAVGTLEPVSREAYEIGPELARGGLGRILVAKDKRLGRSVALKELLAADPSAEARFVREALITARLQHPAIVPVHEAGRWPDGRPFYAMKLVSGDSLATVVGHRPILVDRLALLPNLVTVCEAMAYAHAKKVIHRDLKPHNILIGEFGESVIVDWGLAKLIGAGAAARPRITKREKAIVLPLPPSSSVPTSPGSSETVAGEVIGTPAYMPPEQARAQPVDERADVYSLGAVLYFVLAGAPPYDAEETRAPSERHPLAEVLRAPPPSLALRAPGAPPDLVAIVEKAMAREAAARYANAGELAEDLRRFQLGKLVSSRQYTTWEIFRRFVSRHRAAAAAAVLALTAVAAVGAVAIVRIVRERDLAAAAEKVAVAERSAADGARAQAEARARELILVHAHAWLDRDPTASLAWLKVYPVGAETQAVRAIAVDAESRGVAHDVWRRHEALVWALAADRSGQRVASASADGTVRLWDLPTGSSVVLASGGGEVNTVAFAPDDRLLASGTDDGSVWIWDLSAQPPRVLHRLEGHRRPVTGVVFAADGSRVWAAGYDGTIRAWDLPSAQARPPLVVDTRALQVIALSPDGRWFAVGTAADGLRVIDAATGARRAELSGPKNGVFAAQFAPSGELAAGGRDGSVWRWPDLRAPGELVGRHDNAVYGLAYTKDAAHIVTSSTDRTIRIWRLGAADLRVLRGHDEPVQAVVVTGDGTAVVSAGLDRSLRRWLLPEKDEAAWLPPDPLFGAMVAGERGSAVIAHGNDGVLSRFDPDGGRFTVLGRHGARAAALAESPRGWITGGVDGRVQIVGGPSARGWRAIDRVAWAGGRVAVLADGRLSLWNPDDGRTKDVLAADSEVVVASSDGRTLAWSHGPEVWRCALPDCAAPERVATHKTWIKSLAFSPDGQLLASGSGDRELRLVGPDGERTLPGATSMTTLLAFDGRGQILVGGGRDGGVRVWRVSDGTARLLGQHSAGVTALAISPDGGLVASGGGDRTVRIWDVATGEGQVLRGHRGAVETVIWIEPRALLSAEEEGTIRLWRADPTAGIPRDPHSLRAWLELETTARVEHDQVASP